MIPRFGNELSRRWRLLALAAVWLAAGVGLCAYAWATYGDPYADATLARWGLKVNGPVQQIEPVPGAHAWRVEYDFLDVPGRKFHGSLTLPDEKVVHQLERTGNVPVVFLSSDPRVNTMQGMTVARWSEDRATALVAVTAASLLPLIWAFAAAALAAGRAPTASPAPPPR